LKNEFPEGDKPTLAEGLKLAAKVLLKTMDTTTPSAEKVREGGKEGCRDKLTRRGTIASQPSHASGTQPYHISLPFSN